MVIIFMRSLIHTNPTTKEVRWCVANIIDMELSIEQYIVAVDLGFREDETHKPENFHWALEPEGINMRTHEYKNGGFVAKPAEQVIPRPARPVPSVTNNATPAVQ
jgi:hypothetical protein